MSNAIDFNNLVSVQLVDKNSTYGLTPTYNHYYKMRGFNTSTHLYETWVSTGIPNLTPESGNSLIDIILICDWMGE